MARRAAERRTATIFVRSWLPVMLYVTMILLLSAQPRLRSPFGFPNGDKLAHLLEYSGLGFLLANGVAGSAARTTKPLVIALAAMCLGIVIGTSDELFQSTVPGRSCSPWDLMADTTGLMLGNLVFAFFRR